MSWRLSRLTALSRSNLRGQNKFAGDGREMSTRCDGQRRLCHSQTRNPVHKVTTGAAMHREHATQ